MVESLMWKDGNDAPKTQIEVNFEADVMDLLLQDDNRKTLDIALAQLPIRERMIIELYLGWGGEPKNFSEIARIIRRSDSRTTQIFKRGIERLRRLLSSMGYF